VVAGDTLVAVNGIKVNAADIKEKLVLSKSAPFKVHLFRRDELREVMLTPLLQPLGKVKLKALDKLEPGQKTLNAAWLGVAWPKDQPKH
jgi:predicted metalloprotease with PDZ domain